MNNCDYGCPLLPTNAFFGGMGRTRVDRDGAHHSSAVLEGGSGLGCDAMVWEHVEVRVRPHWLSQTSLTVTICFEFKGRRV